VISQYAPELEPGDRVLDSHTSTSMTAPGDVTHDAASIEDRRDELWDAPVATVREDPTVRLA
jgi:hypothetical protein